MPNSKPGDQHLTPIFAFEDEILNCGDEIQGESAEEYDDEHIQKHYIQMFANDYINSKRAKKDKEVRQKYRHMYSILETLIGRIQSDHPLNLEEDTDETYLSSDTNRCRDSDLRTLQKANKLLYALIDTSREEKKERLQLRKNIKKINLEKKRNKKRKEILTSSTQGQTLQVTQKVPILFPQTHPGNIFLPFQTPINIQPYPILNAGINKDRAVVSHNSLNHFPFSQESNVMGVGMYCNQNNYNTRV